MIDVTGTKTKPGESGTGRYEFREPTGLSRVPFYVVGFVAAVFMYLRSAFPDLHWPVQQASAKPMPLDDGDEVFAPHSLRLAAARPPEDEPPQPVEEAKDEEQPRSKGGTVVPFPVMRYKLIDSPPINFPPAVEPQDDGKSTASAALTIESPPQAPFSTGRSGNTGAGSSESIAERRNRAPENSGMIRLQEVAAGAVLLIGVDELMASEVDPDGDTVTLGKVWASEGSIAMTGDGIVFSSNAAMMPKDVKVFYEVTDGIATVVRTAIIPVVRGPLIGTANADILVGSHMGDNVQALAGNDIIDARAGNDVISGGDGDDHIQAGAGNDVVFAGAGDDVVFAGEGDDVVSGGDGNDRLMGEAGDDVLSGDEGDDQLSGGDGNDVADGGHGNDLLDGGSGEDRLMGGNGDDTVAAAMDSVTDTYIGGDGADTLDYSSATMALDIDFTTGEVASEEAGTDLVSGFEIVLGGSGDDVFTIGGEAVELTGGDGADTFVFTIPEGVDRPTLIHDILDFVAGDRINVSRFEFTTEQDLEKEDRFSRYYQEQQGDAEGDAGSLELRIVHRNDADDGPMTIFEFDGDGDFAFEMMIEVHGHHQPYLYETATA